MSALDEVGNMGVGIVELDCFTDEYGMAIRPFLATSLATAMLPVIAFLLPAIVLFPWYLLKSQRYRNVLSELGHVRIYLEHQQQESMLATKMFQERRKADKGDVELVDMEVEDDLGKGKNVTTKNASEAASKSTYDSGIDNDETETGTSPLPPPAHPPHLHHFHGGDTDSDEEDYTPAPMTSGAPKPYAPTQHKELQFVNDLPDVDGFETEKPNVTFADEDDTPKVRKDNKRLARKRFNGGPQLSLRGAST